MMTKKRLLTILAHPDDESFGPGGTFAKYAAEGVEVHICIATDGAVGSIEEGMEHIRDNLVAVRAAELEKAVTILGGILHRLDYRDSGMKGDPANNDPLAWIRSDDEEAIGRIVALIRTIRPQVIVTHDPTGGYYHPDHIRCCHVVTRAFFAAADPQQYSHLGEPFQSGRLYYTAFSKTWTNFFSLILRLGGQDPTKIGRNRDIDVTRLGVSAERLHAKIDYARYWDQKERASAAHLSQGGGNGGPFRFVPSALRRYLFGNDTFIRAFPIVPDGFREDNLFPD